MAKKPSLATARAAVGAALAESLTTPVTTAEMSAVPRRRPGDAPANEWERSTATTDVDEWLTKADVEPSAPPIIGTIRGALLMADEEHGGYRVAYALELMADTATRKLGEVVGLGEKVRLNLREYRRGDVVRIRCEGVRDLKGGRTMRLFAIEVRTPRKTGTATVGAYVKELLAQALTTSYRTGPAAPEPGSDFEDSAAAPPHDASNVPF